MRYNKYRIYQYWESLASKQSNIWEGQFDNIPMNRKSLIINPVLLHAKSHHHTSGWAVYPNVHSLLGFIQYIYLPTAFSSIILEDYSEGYYMSEDLGEDLLIFKEEYPDKITQLNKMIRFYKDIKGLWFIDEVDCIEKLINWSRRLNDGFPEEEYSVISFRIFTSPRETVQHIIHMFETDHDIGDLERNIGYTKDQLMTLTEDSIYESDFMKRRFMKLLQNGLIVAG